MLPTTFYRNLKNPLMYVQPWEITARYFKLPSAKGVTVLQTILCCIYMLWTSVVYKSSINCQLLVWQGRVMYVVKQLRKPQTFINQQNNILCAAIPKKTKTFWSFPKDPLVFLKTLGFPRSNPMTNRDGIETSPILLDPEGSGFWGQAILFLRDVWQPKRHTPYHPCKINSYTYTFGGYFWCI